MNFKNEYVSEEDIKKFDLDKLHKEFKPWNWRDGRPSVFTHSWTISGDRKTYLIPVKPIEEVGSSGLLEPTSAEIFILNMSGKTAQFILESADQKGPPFVRVWRLLEVCFLEKNESINSEILTVLKEALTVYGLRGIHYQVPDLQIRFSF